MLKSGQSSSAPHPQQTTTTVVPNSNSSTRNNVSVIISKPLTTQAVVVSSISSNLSKSLPSSSGVDPLLHIDHYSHSHSTTENSKKKMDPSMHPVLKSFLIGSVSGACSTVLFQPLDLLKTRLQAPTPNLTSASSSPSVGMVSLVSQIVRTEKNPFSLWRGLNVSLTRCVPGVGLYFASIHSLKHYVFKIEGRDPTPLESIALGISGRSLSGMVMIPFTVIKTRFESRIYQYNSIREALSSIYRQEGVRGLTCGLIPTLLRDAPFSGLYLLMYTTSKKTVGKEWIESPTFGPSVRFSCGVVAGIGASVLTQPFDVIKTKMQLYPEKFRHVREAVIYIYEGYGVQGYFKGMMPRMIRRTLVAAMSWTVYEQLVHVMGLK